MRRRQKLSRVSAGTRERARRKRRRTTKSLSLARWRTTTSMEDPPRALSLKRRRKKRMKRRNRPTLSPTLARPTTLQSLSYILVTLTMVISTLRQSKTSTLRSTVRMYCRARMMGTSSCGRRSRKSSWASLRVIRVVSLASVSRVALIGVLTTLLCCFAVVNVLQPHPRLPLLAISGIDPTVRLFGPTTSDLEKGNLLDKADEIIQRNKSGQSRRGLGADPMLVSCFAPSRGRDSFAPREVETRADSLRNAQAQALMRFLSARGATMVPGGEDGPSRIVLGGRREGEDGEGDEAECCIM